MKITNSYQPSIADKIFLAGRSIKYSRRLSSDCVAFICGSKDGRDKLTKHHAILKFSYSGNVQYHRVDVDDVGSFIDFFKKLNVTDDE
ncbi:hypothetical protein [Flexibacterium corallicola]|uniref:hypothetical protein n=1 Tax=Flexibacterium corallicola TaxID=3037259 RepID=UPI00286ECE91|nr:hypothetical protein [Pseudovibrio sp. M1P-2-3]